ncbi:hypothetical protein CYMTET_38441 [Cymbomonas tetramitiformis]|uniref:MFS transporter n=1 Tax=Cymbomonas tetramitiformis TaxID=36881 RepID=A0AAE0CC14_9CHLO|nr:hypothetical protein CYMTET_38441 [Cymbomonas tetramitiformis]
MRVQLALRAARQLRSCVGVSGAWPRDDFSPRRQSWGDCCSRGLSGEAPRSPESLPEALRPLGLQYLEVEKLRMVFDRHVTQEGHLDARALLRAAGREGSPAEVSSVVAELDRTGDGRVTWPEMRAAAEAAGESVDGRVRPIYAALILMFASQGAQWPVLPQLAAGLDLDAAGLGLVTGATALARIASNAPAASLAERIGRRPLLVAGPAIMAVGVGGLAASSSFAHLVLCNSLVGVGLAAAVAGAGLYLSDIATPRNRARTTAPVLQSALLGFAAGPAIGGMLVEAVGLQAPFVVCAAVLLGSSGTALALLPETLNEAAARREAARSLLGLCRNGCEEQPEPPPTGILELMRRPALQGLFSVVAINGFSQGAMPVTTVLFMLETLNMSSMQVGGTMTMSVLMMILATQPATWLSDRLESRKTVMLPSLLGNALLTGMLPLATSPAAYSGIFTACAVANAFSKPSISPMLLDSTTGRERARALALRLTVQDVGTLIGASTMGLLASQLGTPAAIQTTATLQVLAALVFAARVPRGRLSPGSVVS